MSTKATSQFLGGLSPRTTRDQLFEHFTQYGPIKNIVIKIDLNNKLFNRGFAFQHYEFPESAAKSVLDTHIINDRKIDCEFVHSDTNQKQIRIDSLTNTKVFVNYVKHCVTDEEFKNHFEQFGKLKQSYIVKDPNTGKSKGFGFIMYFDEESVQKVLGHENILANKKVKIELFHPLIEKKHKKSEKNNSNMKGKSKNSKKNPKNLELINPKFTKEKREEFSNPDYPNKQDGVRKSEHPQPEHVIHKKSDYAYFNSNDSQSYIENNYASYSDYNHYNKHRNKNDDPNYEDIGDFSSKNNQHINENNEYPHYDNAYHKDHEYTKGYYNNNYDGYDNFQMRQNHHKYINENNEYPHYDNAYHKDREYSKGYYRNNYNDYDNFQKEQNHHQHLNENNEYPHYDDAYYKKHDYSNSYYSPNNTSQMWNDYYSYQKYEINHQQLYENYNFPDYNEQKQLQQYSYHEEKNQYTESKLYFNQQPFANNREYNHEYQQHIAVGTKHQNYYQSASTFDKDDDYFGSKRFHEQKSTSDIKIDNNHDESCFNPEYD